MNSNLKALLDSIRVPFLRSATEAELTPLARKTGISLIDDMDLSDLLANNHMKFDPSLSRAWYDRVSALRLISDHKRYQKRSKKQQKLRKARKERYDGLISTESTIIGDMDDSVTNEQTHVTLTEHSGEQPIAAPAPAAPIKMNDGTGYTYDLNSFLSRPVTIYDSIWAAHQQHDVDLFPWGAWSDEPSVRSKLQHYAYFTGTIHIKVSITGTPFHYGKVLLSYQPYSQLNEPLCALEMINGYLGGSIYRPMLINYLSQTHTHKIVDVRDNEPVTFDIPFCSPKQAFRLFNSTEVPTSDTFTDFLVAGSLKMRTINPIGFANDGTATPLSVNVYCWCSDVSLSIPTAGDMVIETESTLMGMASEAISMIPTQDEYANPGPLTNVASAVSRAGHALADIPLISPFARATGFVAGKAAGLLNMLGWSQPVILESAVFVKNNPFTNGATTAGKSTTYKLSVDPKQELTVDPRLAGVDGEDEMSIVSIASRPTYLTSFEWRATDTPLNDILFSSLVQPSLQTRELTTSTTDVLVQPTACSFAAIPFAYWHGTMKFRFEIVCSRYHRGKLIINFEPNMHQSIPLAAAALKLNSTNTTIVDIQDTQDIEMDVEWASDLQWLGMDPHFHDAYSNSILPSIPVFGNNHFCLGAITVRVLNELVEPATGAFVYVNVYVSCPDLQVACPQGNLMNVNKDIPATPVVLAITESTLVSDVMVETGATPEHNSEVHFGERIISFRSMLRRFGGVFGSRVSSPVGNGLTVWSMHHSHYPYISNIISLASPGRTYGSGQLWDYLRYAYMGMRGGTRYRYRVFNSESTNVTDYVKVSRLPQHLVDPTLTTFSEESVSNLDDAVKYIRMNHEGSILFHLSSNGGVEYESPYYSNNRFQFSFNDYEGTIPAIFSNEPQPYDEDYMTKETTYLQADLECHFSGTASDAIGTLELSVAEDFTFLRFNGAPYFTRPDPV